MESYLQAGAGSMLQPDAPPPLLGPDPPAAAAQALLATEQAATPVPQAAQGLNAYHGFNGVPQPGLFVPLNTVRVPDGQLPCSPPAAVPITGIGQGPPSGPLLCDFHQPPPASALPQPLSAAAGPSAAPQEQHLTSSILSALQGLSAPQDIFPPLLPVLPPGVGPAAFPLPLPPHLQAAQQAQSFSSGGSPQSGSPLLSHLQQTLSPSQWSLVDQIAHTAGARAPATVLPTDADGSAYFTSGAAKTLPLDPNIALQAAAYSRWYASKALAAGVRSQGFEGSVTSPREHTSLAVQAAPGAPIPLQTPAAYAVQLNAFTRSYEASLRASLGPAQTTVAMQAQALVMAQQQMHAIAQQQQQLQIQQAAVQQLASQQAALQLAGLSAESLHGMPAAGSATALGSLLYGGGAAIPPVLPTLTQPMLHLPTFGSGTSNASSIPSIPIPTSKKVKVIISAGGQFVKKADLVVYDGGATRLMQLSEGATYAEVLESLERVAGSSIMSAGSANSVGSLPALKYQLPLSPEVYVDVLDDEDVQLMLEEWREAASEGAPGLRLHIFVQWRAPVVQRKTSDGSDDLSNAPDFRSAGSTDGRNTSGEPDAAVRNSWAGGAAKPQQIGFADLAQRMEIIAPSDIQLVKFLGAGGYGEVYLGKWHGSEVAVKCLNPGLFFGGGDGADNSAVAELVKEADMLGNLRHPNVVWVYGMVLPPSKASPESGGSGDGELEAVGVPHLQPGPGSVRPPAIVTEYLSGGSLHAALSRKSEAVAGVLTRLMVALDAAKGMEYLHAKGIVHFDMKSANLLLGHRDRRVICKVADFGLSKQKQQTYVSGISSSRGTLPWIAPEIIKSPDAVTEKVDVYSFGVVLWELWTGREPFEGLNYHALLHQMTSAGVAVRPPMPGTPEWDSTEGGEAPPEPAPGYRALVERCWNERPAKRPAFEAIVRDLAEAIQGLRAAKRTKSDALRNSASAAREGSGASSVVPAEESIDPSKS